MPKKRSAPIARVAPLPEEGFLREPTSPLSLEERAALRAFFNSALWKKVWANAMAGAPPSTPTGLDGPMGGVIANNRLHQMQGWELLKAALASQVEERIPRASRPPDNYPKSLEIDTGVKQ